MNQPKIVNLLDLRAITVTKEDVQNLAMKIAIAILESIVMWTTKCVMNFVNLLLIVQVVTHVMIQCVIKIVMEKMNVGLSNIVMSMYFFRMSFSRNYELLFFRNFGLCMKACKSNSDCSLDDVCMIDGSCQEKCTSDNFCERGYICHDSGTCQYPCSDDFDCYDNEYCHTDEQICIPLCESDESCGDGYICEDGACYKPCENNNECLKNQNCNRYFTHFIILCLSIFNKISSQPIPSLFKTLSIRQQLPRRIVLYGRWYLS